MAQRRAEAVPSAMQLDQMNWGHRMWARETLLVLASISTRSFEGAQRASGDRGGGGGEEPGWEEVGLTN